MSKDNIIKLIQPANVEDQLTEILRTGARALLAQAVEAEVADFLGKHADLKTADGHHAARAFSAKPHRRPSRTRARPLLGAQDRERARQVAKSQQPKAKRALQEIWMAETKAVAELAFWHSTPSSRATRPNTRRRPTAWARIGTRFWRSTTSQPSAGNTCEPPIPLKAPSLVRHRTIRSKGCLSNRTALAMVFKLLEAAQKSWRRLDGHNQLPKLVLGVTFNNGIEVIAKPADRQPATAAA